MLYLKEKIKKKKGRTHSYLPQWERKISLLTPNIGETYRVRFMFLPLNKNVNTD